MRIQQAQMKILKQMTWTQRQKYQTKPHRQDHLDEWGWLNVEQMADNSTIQLARKAALNQTSAGINAMFNYRETKNARKENKNRIETISTKKRNNLNILDRGRNKHNRLPPELRDRATKPHKYKKMMKAFMKTQNKLQKH